MSDLERIPGLQFVDTRLLKQFCEILLETGATIVGSEQVEQCVEQLGVEVDDAFDSLHILEDRMLIKPHWTLGNALPALSVTTHGIENYGRRFVPGFNELVERALLVTVDEKLSNLGDVAEYLEQSLVMTAHLLGILEDRKLIQLAKVLGGFEYWHLDVTAQGRRRAAGIKSLPTPSIDARAALQSTPLAGTQEDIKLIGRQRKELCEALEDAFSLNTLELIVSFHLDMRLETITRPDNLKMAVFNLVTWAEQTGNIRRLLDGALEENANNCKLCALATSYPHWQLQCGGTNDRHNE